MSDLHRNSGLCRVEMHLLFIVLMVESSRNVAEAPTAHVGVRGVSLMIEKVLNTPGLLQRLELKILLMPAWAVAGEKQNCGMVVAVAFASNLCSAPVCSTGNLWEAPLYTCMRPPLYTRT